MVKLATHRGVNIKVMFFPVIFFIIFLFCVGIPYEEMKPENMQYLTRKITFNML